MDQGTSSAIANFIGLIIFSVILAWNDHRNRKRSKDVQVSNESGNKKIKDEVVAQSQTLAEKLDTVNGQLIETLRGRVTEQGKRLDEYAIRAVKLETDNGTLAKTVENYKQLNDQQSEKLQQNNNYIKNLEKIISDARSEFDEAAKRYEKLIADQGRTINDKDVQLAQKDEQISALTAQVNDLIKKLETESELVRTLTQRVTTLEKKVDTLEQQLQSKDSELKATLLNKAELEHQLSAMTAERDAALRDRDEMQTRMQAEIDDLRMLVDSLKARLDAQTDAKHITQTFEVPPPPAVAMPNLTGDVPNA